MPSDQPTVEIIEAYRGYQPPVDVVGTIRLLLRDVPADRLAGLKRIVLMNAGGLSREHRREKTLARGKAINVIEALAAYRPASGSEPARIELFVDKILARRTPELMSVSVVRSQAFARSLYRGIGNHTYAASHHSPSEKETLAERWARQHTARFMRTHYWYLLPLVWLGYPIRLLKKLRSESRS
jgi:hypothetical protein